MVPKTLSGKIRRVELRQQETDRQDKGGGKGSKQEYFYEDFPELSSKKK
jgi:hypothetical protein